MIEGYEKLELIDTNDRQTGVTFEVNWDENPETNECKVLKMTLPDKSTHYISKDMFVAFMWVIGTADEQKKMIPQTVIHTKWYETVLGIKATKDIKKGEMINVPVKLSLPDERREAIAELKRDSGLIIPK